MPSHTHTQNAHNHSANINSFVQSNVDLSVNSTKRAVTSQGGSNWHYVYVSDDNYKSTQSVSNSRTTANNTATNQYTGGEQAHNNMPPFLAVNVWKRVS